MIDDDTWDALYSYADRFVSWYEDPVCTRFLAIHPKYSQGAWSVSTDSNTWFSKIKYGEDFM